MTAIIQSDFACALLDADKPVPQAIASSGARAPQKRFAVYRNNVMIGLIEALRARFPVAEKIVGADFFAAMARVFVTAHPPRSPLLLHYGDAFADFIESFPPAAELPYLADVARLEAARTRAYHAADAAPLDPKHWRTLDPQILPRMRIALHPSMQVVRSNHPVVTIWAMNAGERELAPIEDWRGEDALIARPALEVEVRQLPPGGAAFLAALMDGTSFGVAAERTASRHPEFDLPANLAGLIGAGLATAMTVTAIQEDLAS